MPALILALILALSASTASAGPAQYLTDGYNIGVTYTLPGAPGTRPAKSTLDVARAVQDYTEARGLADVLQVTFERLQSDIRAAKYPQGWSPLAFQIEFQPNYRFIPATP
jgi:hypothetical protein